MSKARQSGSATPVLAAILILVVVAPILYLLSLGPAVWLVEHGFIAGESIETFYLPVIALHESCPPIQPILEGYVELFI